MLNHITIMGRMTKDPELRRTGSGVAVASFTIACDRDRAPEGQEKETDFIDCVAWRNTAEFVDKYFSKGRMIVVSGRLQIRPWTDKEGNKRRSAEIVADNVYFGDSKKDDGQQAQNQPQYGGYQAPQYNAPPQSYPQYGYQQPPQQPAQQLPQQTPNYVQSGFGGYQQPAYPQQGYQPPFPPQGSFAPIEGDDGQLPF